MTHLNLELSDEEAAKLKAFAAQSGINLEDAARLAIRSLKINSANEWIEPEDEDFQRITDALLKENAELYRRLA